MILLGYPGIGKSFLAKIKMIDAIVRGNYIYHFRMFDLDSSTFVVDDKKIESWEIPYCRIS